jgi:hypothetical protein
VARADDGALRSGTGRGEVGAGLAHSSALDDDRPGFDLVMVRALCTLLGASLDTYQTPGDLPEFRVAFRSEAKVGARVVAHVA